jgi:hypothetical protein
MSWSSLPNPPRGDGKQGKQAKADQRGNQRWIEDALEIYLTPGIENAAESRSERRKNNSSGDDAQGGG